MNGPTIAFFLLSSLLLVRPDPEQKPADTKPTETPIEKPAQDKPAQDKPTEKPADKPSDKPATKAKPLVSFPHPLITEILYAVPTGDRGDANGDGTRHATGDEFVELANPHDRPINLKGYTITDRSKGKPGSLRFTFPSLTLAPGQVAVVFNGYASTFAGAVGDSSDPPKEGNKKFSGAFVFTMKMTSPQTALANSGDCVILMAPDGATIEMIKWGKFEDKLPDAGLVEEAPPTSKGSVQRKTFQSGFVVHESLEGGLPFSPGKFPASGDASEPSAKDPAPATPAPKDAGKTPANPEEKKKPDKKKPGK